MMSTGVQVELLCTRELGRHNVLSLQYSIAGSGAGAGGQRPPPPSHASTAESLASLLGGLAI